jgi:hypothetical protein
LNELPRVIFVAHETQRDRKGAPLMTLDKVAEGRLVSPLCSLNKLTILICLTTSSLTVGRLLGGAIHAPLARSPRKLRGVSDLEPVQRLPIEPSP